MTPTSAGCTPQMTLSLDLSFADVEGCQPCRNTRPGESSVPCTPEKDRPDGGKSYETPDGRGIIEARFARKSSWELFTAQPNYSQNMAVDAQSVVLPCFTYDSLSHATLRYLLPQNCACELSHKRYTLTQTLYVPCALVRYRIHLTLGQLFSGTLRNCTISLDAMTISTWKSTSVVACTHVVMFIGYAVPENVHSDRTS